MNLPTDTYYRGYRLSEFPDSGKVNIYKDAEYIDTVDGKSTAHSTVDGWLDAP